MSNMQAPAPQAKTWGERIFAALARLGYYHPLTVLVVCLALAALCLVYTSQYLVFDSNRSNLIKRTPELQAKQDRYVDEFPLAEDIVVIVEGGTAAECKQFVDDLCLELRAEPEIFNSVFEKVDASFLRSYALHYLDIDDLRTIASGLRRNSDLLSSLARSRSIVDLAPLLKQRDFGHISDDDLLTMLPVVNGFAEQLQRCVDCRGRHFKYRSPWLASFMHGGDEISQNIDDIVTGDNFAMYSTLASGRMYVVVLRPTYTEGLDHPACIERSIVRLKSILKTMALNHTTIIPRLTGELVLDYDEGQSSSEDSVVSSIISIVLVGIIFMWAFHELYRPLMAIFALAIGIAWTMGFTTLVVGHLNLLTVTCTTILIGLGIDYGIHFIYRYEEERVAGREPLEAMTATLVHAGQENFTGAFSTAIAFWVLNFTDFTGIAELGTIAGSGILLCYASTVLVLPALLYWFESWNHSKERVGLSSFEWLADLERKWLQYPGWMAIAFLAFSVWCGYHASKLQYDYNLLNLQSQNLDSVKSELYLINSSEHSLLCGISLVYDSAEAKRLMAEYEKLPTVATTECVALMVPEDYSQKCLYLHEIADIMARIPEPTPWQPESTSMIKRLMALGRTMHTEQDTLTTMMDDLVNSPNPKIAEQGRELKQRFEKLGRQLENMLPGPIGDSLNAFDRAFFTDVYGLLSFMKQQKAAPELTFRDMPATLRCRELGTNGAVQIRIFPKENVWDRAAQERFVKDIEKVDPQVVGMPVMMYYDSQVLREANEQAGLYALVAIWVLLFLYFRNAKLALLALMPKVVGVLWMVGMMGACGVNFNSANSLALPMILGIGLVFGIHVVHRVLEVQDAGIFSHSTGPAIALAALTTMAGFGTLMVANYQGIASLGFVMTVGVGANLVSSAVLLPVVIKLLNRTK